MMEGQSMCQMSKQLGGSTALDQYMAGVMSRQSRNQLLVGLLLFLSLNLIGKYAWLVAYPQDGLNGTESGLNLKMLLLIQKRTGVQVFRGGGIGSSAMSSQAHLVKLH